MEFLEIFRENETISRFPGWEELVRSCEVRASLCDNTGWTQQRADGNVQV
ncbi:unnamed protein product, partial [Vitis vinifera]